MEYFLTYILPVIIAFAGSVLIAAWQSNKVSERTKAKIQAERDKTAEKRDADTIELQHKMEMIDQRVRMQNAFYMEKMDGVQNSIYEIKMDIGKILKGQDSMTGTFNLLMDGKIQINKEKQRDGV